MIRVSLVSYLNSKPFLNGIQNFKDELSIDLSLDVPSESARKLLNNEADIGLIPVAVLPFLKEKYILSDYCIGALGKVSSVMLYSKMPLQEIQTIALDFQSRTSVMLVKVLAKYLWKISPDFKSANSDEDLIPYDRKACVVIGDRTFKLNGQFAFEFDLAEEWYKLTGMPFVFACWVANKKIDKNFIEKFNNALKYGVDSRKEMLSNWQKECDYIHLDDYLMNKIRYELGEQQKKALDKFLNYLNENSF